MDIEKIGNSIEMFGFPSSEQPTNEEAPDDPEKSAESELAEMKKRVEEILASTTDEKINEQIANDNPDFYNEICEIKNSDLDGKTLSEDEIKAKLTDALPRLEEYKAIYEQIEQQLATEPEEKQVEEEKLADFYSDLSQIEDEQRFPEAIEIYELINWQVFPNEVETESPEEMDESAQETEETIAKIQSFAEEAKNNPPNKFGLRDLGADDKLILGDKYNKLISDFQKLTETKALNGEPGLSSEQAKTFCHELASIIHDYENDKEIWKTAGEKSLEEAFDAYADVKGIEAVKNDLGDKIPEEIDIYSVMPLISEINDVVRKDWQEKITSANSYMEGSAYSFICSRVVEPFTAQDNRNNIFSGSLITDSHHETIGNSGNFGFTLPPDNIIAAAPHDMFTYNWSNDDNHSVNSGVPVIMSYDKVLRDSQKNETYSEITTRDMPNGIFYIKDKITDEEKIRLNKLIELNPGLPVVAL